MSIFILGQKAGKRKERENKGQTGMKLGISKKKEEEITREKMQC